MNVVIPVVVIWLELCTFYSSILDHCRLHHSCCNPLWFDVCLTSVVYIQSEGGVCGRPAG